jgi:hypothetical protein
MRDCSSSHPILFNMDAASQGGAIPCRWVIKSIKSAYGGCKVESLVVCNERALCQKQTALHD